MSYWRFAAMIATSTVVMFGLMYLNTYLFEHVFYSETRVYMAIMMGGVMAFIMLGFMLSMYSSRTINVLIFVGSVLVAGFALGLVRSQVTVGDRSYMKAMIPHHSIAIMTSSRADIEDPRVRKLADEIIYAQDKEIAEMRYLIADIDRSGRSDGESRTEPARLTDIREALATPETATLDAEFLAETEITEALPDDDVCLFRYTSQSEPSYATSLAGGQAAGLVKISGDLVRLEGDEKASMSSDDLVVRLMAVGEGASLTDANETMIEADMILQIGDDLEVGYRGYFECRR
ncbi:MAG: DUF305 domain-containing protein [Fulvimarina manganoxydans]|uniref:DUF305 domain-containing protein n=1 Tax=Fulvimarina manganoxydans TaxID=937218 RepID=UPI002352E7A1|nr:DUF305 domain-containing protein [Fulvimarina manganoxydans]MCK5931032.1 DUF305 domain-containing protein [Fulvimarina manganoxydans]